MSLSMTIKCKSLIEELRNIANQLGEYRDKAIDRKPLYDNVTAELSQIYKTADELTKLLSLKERKVRVDNLTLKQMQRICSRYEVCTECPLCVKQHSGEQHIQLCKPYDSKDFGTSHVLVTVFEEDLYGGENEK